MKQLLLSVLLLSALSTQLVAQRESDQNAADSGQNNPAAPPLPKSSRNPIKGTLFNLLPAPEKQAFRPLTQSQRTNAWLHSTFGRFPIIAGAVSATIPQVENTPSEWGRGADGYARRVGNLYGIQIIRNTVQFGIASVSHEDTRYFASGKSGFGPRLLYALTSPILARHDNGNRSLSYSYLAGLGAASGISRVWQPHSTGGLSDAISTFGIFLGVDMGVDVVKEFRSKP